MKNILFTILFFAIYIAVFFLFFLSGISLFENGFKVIGSFLFIICLLLLIAKFEFKITKEVNKITGENSKEFEFTIKL